MKIRIVAGGPENLIPDFTRYDKGADILWIGVDRGTFVLLKHNIVPNYAFGDFDSVSEAEKNEIISSEINLNIFRAEKDQTDMELAFQWALNQNPVEIFLFGATGGRLDHEMLNIQLLYKSINEKADVRIVDRNNEISLHRPGRYSYSNVLNYKYVSFLAFNEKVAGITLDGFKYPLQNADLQVGSSLCISNELVKKSGTYSFDSGIIMMVKSRD